MAAKLGQARARAHHALPSRLPVEQIVDNAWNALSLETKITLLLRRD